jgi:hypothetical protein
LTIAGKNIRYHFLIWLLLYFLVGCVAATGWSVNARFRIAMLPSIAVIASAGWFKISSFWQKRFTRHQAIKLDHT